MLATLAFISGTTLLLWQSSFLSLRLAKGLALATLVLLGALNLQLRRPGSPTDPRILPLADGRELSITAHVIKEGKVRSAGFGGMRQSVDIETEEIGFQGQSLPLRCGNRLGIYAREPKPAV